tara:strand:- start:697 stop:1281 length:585 start_codon:yes stop_codon:yes gene_type:complete
MATLLQHPLVNQMMETDAVESSVPLAKSAKDWVRNFAGDEGEVSPRVVHSAMLASTGLTAFGVYNLVTDIAFARNRLVDMLMHDKFLPEQFAGGKFADLIRSQKEDYIHLSHRPSPGIVSMAGEAVDAWRMRADLAGELKKGGVGILDAMKEYRVADRFSMLRSAGMAAAGVTGWAMALKHQRALENELSPGRS